MKKLMSFFNLIEDYLAPLFFAIMCISIAAQVICRLIIKKPLLYTEELARYCYIWCVYLAIPMGEKYQDHFFVDIFVKFLHGKANLILIVIERAIEFVMFSLMFYWSIKFVKFEKIIRSPAFGISMGLIAASMTVGFFLCFLHKGTQLISAVKALFSSKVKDTCIAEKD